MKRYTHYDHEKYLAETFTIKCRDMDNYKKYIRQLTYSRDLDWFHVLTESGFTKSQLQFYLKRIKVITGDHYLDTNLKEDKDGYKFY